MGNESGRVAFECTITESQFTLEHTHTQTHSHTPPGQPLTNIETMELWQPPLVKGRNFSSLNTEFSTKNTFTITQKFRINRYLSVSEKGRKQNSKSLHM